MRWDSNLRAPQDTGKVEYFVKEHGALEIPQPDIYESMPKNYGFVCVVYNTGFEAAAYVYSKAEFVYLTSYRGDDPRKRVWLLMRLDVINRLMQGDWPS